MPKTEALKQQEICRKLHEELKAVADSPRLSMLTAQTVGKSLQLLVERAELMSPGGTALTLTRLIALPSTCLIEGIIGSNICFCVKEKDLISKIHDSAECRKINSKATVN